MRWINTGLTHETLGDVEIRHKSLYFIEAESLDALWVAQSLMGWGKAKAPYGNLAMRNDA